MDIQYTWYDMCKFVADFLCSKLMNESHIAYRYRTEHGLYNIIFNVFI